MGNYRISNTHPFDDDDLCTARFEFDPRSSYTPGAERVTTLAGTTEDVGYQRSIWTFSALSIAQWSALKSLVGGESGEVYIETRNDVDTWAEYRALARLPNPGDLTRAGGYYESVTVTLLLLEDVTP
ncbi:MAG: hypothetical protein GVY30_00215 [Chloroflexi bacterium]|jgi:hypothetical protein|nr:hypothetical protein [Chloroflexota bacterium]